ncbi:Aste57867_18642 [Aphanomyces stellatus]|uniref:Aste57867_18642 protein n=1 Tax=Aphanomyces stellatus TaxID=120398 RepID=A0A485LBI4_9STRA|nr:hypothetical protein As57867_018580 [Aphanomyces stellatus]VFT95377.1 Aste57867_18642 [Aphanomyces stellatus]
MGQPRVAPRLEEHTTLRCRPSVSSNANLLLRASPVSVLGQRLWWPKLNTSGVQSFLIDLVNTQLNSTFASLRLPKNYGMAFTPLYLQPTHARKTVLDNTAIESAIERLLVLSVDEITALPTQHCWDRDNGAVYLEPILRVVDEVKWETSMGSLYQATIISGLTPASEGLAWKASVAEMTVTSVDTETNYWRGQGITRFLCGHRTMDFIMEAIRSAGRRNFPQPRHHAIPLWPSDNGFYYGGNPLCGATQLPPAKASRDSFVAIGQWILLWRQSALRGDATSPSQGITRFLCGHRTMDFIMEAIRSAGRRNFPQRGCNSRLALTTRGLLWTLGNDKDACQPHRYLLTLSIDNLVVFRHISSRIGCCLLSIYRQCQCNAVECSIANGIELIQFINNDTWYLLRHPVVGNSSWAAFGWSMVYVWLQGNREGVAFEGDNGALTLTSKRYEFIPFPAQASDVPRTMGFYLWFITLYTSLTLTLVRCLCLVYGFVFRFECCGQSMVYFNRIVGCVWVGRPALFARGMSAAILLCSTHIELEFDLGLTWMVPQKRSWIDSMVIAVGLYHASVTCTINSLLFWLALVLFDVLFPTQMAVLATHTCEIVPYGYSCTVGSIQTGDGRRVCQALWTSFKMQNIFV